jgi:hypothetical protein
VDELGRFVVTGSDDKTVRIWSVGDGRLLQTIRLPAGPGNIGKVYAVEISPDGEVVAAGGWFANGRENSIWFFDPNTGATSGRIVGVPDNANRLVFSPNGNYLAAGFPFGGLRVYDRHENWSEVFRDEDYGGSIYGIAFAGDGRLATTSHDGKVRLYDQKFRLLLAKQAPGGSKLAHLAFSPDGAVLALGYIDVPMVSLLDGRTLVPLEEPDVAGLNAVRLTHVAWSKNGRTLFAGGALANDSPDNPIFAWAGGGQGLRRAMSAARDQITALVPLPEDGLLVATADPYLAVLEANGNLRWPPHTSQTADFRGLQDILAVSVDGKIIDFTFDALGEFPLRFNLDDLELTGGWPSDGHTVTPKQYGLPIEAWYESYNPMLDGNLIQLSYYGISHSMAIYPDNKGFVLGTSMELRAMDVEGELLWTRAVPEEPWAVNITGDARLVVAAYGDGTIRWHRMDDGRELLALMVLADRTNWVAWTPEGFYAATPGARGVLQWHVNRGADAAAVTVPVSEIPKLSRPDALPLVLQELETARALGIADMTAARFDVQRVTGAAKAPGARLHILAIGVSDYGEQAKKLRLQFADKDARDLASTLIATQDSSLNKRPSFYAEVYPIVLQNKEADRPGIFEAFAAMQRNMAKSDPGSHTAVVLFSGHGTIIDDQLYLLPYGVDNSTPARIKASAILASEFQASIAELAEHGRVLVLLDACRTGAVTEDGSRLPPNADLLRILLAQNNVTVLTSSQGDKLSREDKKWENGAFTEVVLEALGRAADSTQNGMISVSELTAYVAANLPILTDGEQTPGIEQRFQSDIFVAGL